MTDHGIAVPRAKHTLYDAGLRTALLVRYPPVVASGVRREELLSNLDLYPTLCDLAGLPTPDTLRGTSFAPLLSSERTAPRADIMASFTFGQRSGLQYYTPMRCLRTRRHKLIRNYCSDPTYLDGGYVGRFAREREILESWPLFGNAAPPVELYDLENDPWELTNLADSPQHVEIRARLSGRLDTLLTGTGDEILSGAVASKKASPVVQEWVLPGGADRYRSRFDPHHDTREKPFPATD